MYKYLLLPTTFHLPFSSISIYCNSIQWLLFEIDKKSDGIGRRAVLRPSWVSLSIHPTSFLLSRLAGCLLVHVLNMGADGIPLDSAELLSVLLEAVLYGEYMGSINDKL